jgi:hypothetical protein
MKTLFLFLLPIVLLTSCNNTTKQKDHPRVNDSELILDPDKKERFEAIKNLKKAGCAFIDPDTSLSGIIIRNAESVTKIVGDQNELDSMEQCHFYTKLERETLTLTQHPGDGKNKISIFKVEYSDKASYGYKQLSIDTLKTEKGIRLGLTKKQIIQKLGSCYAALDSISNYIELYYRIEMPNDSKTSLLARHKIPAYYASYKICNDRLRQFEFGFEYP